MVEVKAKCMNWSDKDGKDKDDGNNLAMQGLPTSEGQNFDLAKYIVSSTRYEYSIKYIVSYDTIHYF